MKGRCVCGCRRKAVQRHHVVYVQELRRVLREEYRREGLRGPPDIVRELMLTRDPRNLVAVAHGCHAAHHARSAPLALRVLPDSVFVFALEVLGAGAAYEYLRRRYSGDDARLSQLLEGSVAASVSARASRSSA